MIGIRKRLDQMTVDWFPEGFSIAVLQKQIDVIVEAESPSKLQELVNEHDVYATPKIVMIEYPVYGGYEKDYKFYINRNLNESSTLEAFYISAALAYLSYNRYITLDMHIYYGINDFGKCQLSKIANEAVKHFHRNY